MPGSTTKYTRDRHPWSQEFEEDQIDARMARKMWKELTTEERAWVRRTQRALGIAGLGEIGTVELLMKISLLEVMSE